jgi:hypothetical protein
MDRQEALEELATWATKHRDDAHAFDCKYRLVTVDHEHKTAKHEKCTCGLDEILNKLNG